MNTPTEVAVKSLLVLNQSQSPAFQNMIERAAQPASVTFLNGQGFAPARGDTQLRSAPVYDRRSVLHRARSWGRYLASALTFAVRRSEFVLAVTNPPFLPHVAWALSHAHGVRYGLLIWDIYPGHLHQIGWLQPKSPVSRVWERCNDAALNRAEFVVTIGEQMAGALRERTSRRQDIHVIPNWADTSQLRPILRESNPLRRKLEVQDELVVMYSGNLGASHGLDGLLDAATALRNERDVCFRVVGGGLGRAQIERVIERRQLSNVKVFDAVSWEEFPQLQALADVAVVTQAPGTEHLSVPSKTYSALAAGNAVLALTDRKSDLGELVEAHGVGRVCGFSAAAEVERTLRSWAANRAELELLKVRARQIALSTFSAESVTHSWRELLRPALLK